MSKVRVIMYHYVRDLDNSRYPRIKGLDYNLFRQQIEYLDRNFHIITMEEFKQSWEGHYELPDNAVLLTFDDGYIDHYTFVMPVLMEYGVQGSFFISSKTFSENKLLDVNKVHFILANSDINNVVTDLFQLLDFYRGKEFDIPSNESLFQKYAVGNRFDSKETIFVKRVLQTGIPNRLRNIISSEIFQKHVGVGEEKFAKELYLNYEQIKCMKKCGMFIGIHGHDHFWLGNVEPDVMKEDISKALTCMDGVVDTNDWVINYPYGSWNEGVIDYVKTQGCNLGLTTEVRLADTKTDNRYLIPRFDTNDFPPKSENYKLIG